MSDEQVLLQGARRFEEQALGDIYDRYSQGMYRYAIRLLGDDDLAEDCVAETFSRFLMALKHGKGPNDYLQAYLYRVAHNWISDYYRRQGMATVTLDPEAQSGSNLDPDETLVRQQEQERVRSALMLLTPDQRQVIVLKYLEGWRNQEIAEALEKPVGAVKALQHRAIKSLRRQLVGEIIL